MDLQAAEYSIGAANAEDMGRVRTMLPRAFSGNRQPRIRVAKRLDTSQIIGVVTWWLRPRKDSYQQAAFFIRVANIWLSRGVGDILMRELINEVRETGASELVTGALVEEAGAVENFLTALGFTRRLRITQYEDNVERLREIFSPLYERYTARHKMPAAAKLVSLDEAPLEEVRDLVLRHLGGLPLGIDQRLQDGPGGYDRNLSVVLMMDGKVTGALLARVKNGVKISDAMVVAPEMRGSWASLFIKQASLEKTMAAGIETVRYSVNEKKHPDTVKQAMRTGAKMCGYKVIMGKNI